MSPWWSEATGTLLGAFGGAGIGVLCGIYGGVAGMLGAKGRGRGLVLGMHLALLGVGLLALLVGVVGLALGQPHHVWFPLLLPGFVVTAVMGPLLPVVRQRYRAADARRLEAEHIRRSR